MNRTYKYRLYPNKTQAERLDFLLWQGRKIYGILCSVARAGRAKHNVGRGSSVFCKGHLTRQPKSTTALPFGGVVFCFAALKAPVPGARGETEASGSNVSREAQNGDAVATDGSR